MKKILLIWAVIASAFITKVNAQVYSFELDNEPYQALTGVAYDVFPNTILDLNFIPLGFNFMYQGQSSDTLSFNWFNLSFEVFKEDSFEYSPGSYYNYSSALGLFPHLYFDELQDRGFELNGISSSKVSYQTVGNPGSKIFKLQFSNYGYSREIDSLGTSNNFTNFQVWLYEGSNMIEYRYGATDWSIIIYGPSLGLVGISDINLFAVENGAPYNDNLVFFMGDNANNPSVIMSLDSILFEEANPIMTMPSSGTIYRFTTFPSSINEVVNKSTVQLYPNPTTQQVNLTVSDASQAKNYQLFDLQGRIVLQGHMVSEKTSIDVSGLSKGLYMLKAGNSSQKLVIE